ncbi:M protein repeat protein [Aspergillus terreus]|uniref:M protein repeat protein n=1 Tax=Aspergillus terreus TaxID=33178 RepID=A0A5M3ZC21_ASPTE|nr:hypothetical protein ATETN484_0013018000 [Aspergillus terreus]GFF20414.1 M protein repeat protein [Aspergillus terreus]
MADEEERLKAEKLAAAKKRVAQLQKQKKKANKKASTKDSEPSKDAAAPSEPEPAKESAPDETAEQKPSEEKHTEQPKPDEQPSEQPSDTKDNDKADETTAEPPREESPTEPMPDAPTSPGPDVQPQLPKIDTAASPPSRGAHGRQPSLSIQSKMRSSSFRKTSISQGSLSPSPSAAIKSPSLPPLTADGDSVHEVYRKQSTRIDELEKENKRLEKELEEGTARWKKTEEELEDLREASVDAAELKDRLEKAEQKAGEIEELKAEIASLQRQNSHLQTRTHRNNASVSAPGPSESPPSDLMQQLESKSATIEAMELEISNLRAQLSSSAAHETQISALEEKLARSESTLEKSQNELTDTKAALTRASEKAVKEGVDKTSTETLIKSLQRETEELKTEKAEATKKIETLEKKLEAMGNLHRESEARHQARLRESEKTEKEAAVLRKRLASVENENLRLKEDLETLRKRDGGADDDALDELEDEERSRLQRRIRELEGEVFDLRRGVWKEKRQELDASGAGDGADFAYADSATNPSAANAFDDVDLVGGTPEHARRRSMAMQQHSSFSTVLSSGIAAFTGGGSFGGGRGRAGSHQQHPPATRGSLELLSEENFDDEFDEAEFARAQAEEEARKRVEWVREIKKKLRDWQGWRLDLVDSRAGAEGAGVGMGEIFQI